MNSDALKQVLLLLLRFQFYKTFIETGSEPGVKYINSDVFIETNSFLFQFSCSYILFLIIVVIIV